MRHHINSLVFSKLSIVSLFRILLGSSTMTRIFPSTLSRGTQSCTAKINLFQVPQQVSREWALIIETGRNLHRKTDSSKLLPTSSLEICIFSSGRFPSFPFCSLRFLPLRCPAQRSLNPALVVTEDNQIFVLFLLPGEPFLVIRKQSP